MPRAPLPSGADVVIVGGGVVGASAAFHLAEAGAQVVLLERDQLASGSTSKAAGGLRAQFSDALNIEIGKRSLQAYKRFGERPGWEIDYEEIGYLFVLTTEGEVEAFRRSVALQNALGVPSRIITPEEAREISPLLAGEDILAASYCPTDAHATPESVVQGYAYGAREYGAHLAVSTPVEGIDVVDDVIKAVRTPHGTVEKLSLINDRDTGQPRGFGFVEMSSADASRAMQALNGADFGGRPLKINEAQDKARSGGGGGGGGGRPRY